MSLGVARESPPTTATISAREHVTAEVASGVLWRGARPAAVAAPVGLPKNCLPRGREAQRRRSAALASLTNSFLYSQLTSTPPLFMSYSTLPNTLF